MFLESPEFSPLGLDHGDEQFGNEEWLVEEEEEQNDDGKEHVEWDHVESDFDPSQEETLSAYVFKNDEDGDEMLTLAQSNISVQTPTTQYPLQEDQDILTLAHSVRPEIAHNLLPNESPPFFFMEPSTYINFADLFG